MPPAGTGQTSAPVAGAAGACCRVVGAEAVSVAPTFWGPGNGVAFGSTGTGVAIGAVATWPVETRWLRSSSAASSAGMPPTVRVSTSEEVVASAAPRTR